MSKLQVVAEPGRQEISITRLFDAPPELVFEAFTDPDAIPQWWGLRSSETKMTDRSVFQSLEDRDGMLSSGMEGGAGESMDRLDELLAKGRAART
jgi:uncharacterized protein YndB with AHSA1/START domain